MSEWKEEILDELVDVDPEQLSLSTDADYSFFYIDISSVSPGKINYPIHQIMFKGSPSRARKILKVNDILMSTVRPNLKAFAQFKRKSRLNFIASTGFAILRAKPNTDIDFIYQSLFSNEIERQIETLVVGSNYPAINASDVKKLKINTPSLPAQRHIAHILSTCDALREKTQAAIAKCKAIKQGMLHDLFTRGIDPAAGKLRPKYEDAPDLYKDSELGKVPKDWEVAALVKYLSFISYGFTNPMPETSDGPFLVTAANVNGGRILYDSCRKTSREAFDNLLTDKSRPKRNDILLTKDGTLGRVALVEQENLCINQSVAVLRPNLLIHPLFLKILLESPAYQKTMLDEAGGSTIKHIYITIVDKMFVAVPATIDEQEEIASRLNTIELRIQNEQNYLHKLQSIKQGLMADLLSGKKRVKLPEEA